MVVPGDEVHVRGGERERIVVMQWTVVKRVGAPVAVTCYLDRSSPHRRPRSTSPPAPATAAPVVRPNATAP